MVTSGVTVPNGAALDLQPGIVSGTISSDATTGALTLGTAGNYLIEWVISQTDLIPVFNVDVDGTAAPTCTSVILTAGPQGAENHCIISVAAGTVVTLVNNSGQSAEFFPQGGLAASMVVQQMS